MSIIINEDTRIIIQGITGKQGTYHAKKMLEYGVKIVAGITPGKGGTEVHGIPVYDTVREAASHHSIDFSIIMVPAPFVLGAAVEAIENKIPTVLILTEHVPVHDTMYIKNLAEKNGVRVIGPNTMGIIAPGKTKAGVMPVFLYGNGGKVAIVSRSGTLCHESASNLTFRGIGVSMVMGIGGDPIIGTSFVDALKLLKDDPETEAVVLIGEIGGSREEAAAEYLETVDFGKKVFAFIAGRYAPPGKKMGHAGAIIDKGVGTAAAKLEKLAKAGVTVAGSIEDLIQKVEDWYNAKYPGELKKFA
ncbi:MAG: succinate--CoA ligase subunit alpha [Clostridia bacterium]|nr:succinate--CoA ligase subunit alpha [Clostridia bacterium]